MNSRDAILKNIRDGLAGSPSPPTPPVPEVWARTDATVEQMLDRFTTELDGVQGEMVRCASMEEARRELAALCEKDDWKTLGAVERETCRALCADLPPNRVAWAKDGWDPNDMAQLPAGLVAAECLIADTGTCVVENNTAEERLMCFLPPTCVVVARTAQLVEHLPAAWHEIARRTAEPERRGEFVLITGPSRTADIEKILILGVHGPKRLVVLLID